MILYLGDLGHYRKITLKTLSQDNHRNFYFTQKKTCKCIYRMLEYNRLKEMMHFLDGIYKRGKDMEKISNQLIASIAEEAGKENLERIVEAGYQLTAYENAGAFDFEKFKVNQWMENYVLEVRDYHEYAREELYDDFYENIDEELNDAFGSPAGAIKAATYGTYNYHDDYFKFDGYGNLQSFNEYELEDIYGDKEEVIKYCIDHMSYAETDFLEEHEELIKAVAIELVNQGY